MKRSHWFKVFLPFLLLPAVAWADAYDISVQGYVEREEEAVTGTIECDFALYSGETGGDAIWSLTESVTVDGGVFTASLGADDFPEPEDFPADLYLGMTCDGEEFSPRLQFTGVPMAHRAEYAERAGVADSISSDLLPDLVVTGGGLTVSGDAFALENSGVTAGTYGSATQAPVVVVDAKGRITSASNTTISGVAPGGAAGGDLTGTYPNPTIAANSVALGDDTTGNYVATIAAEAGGEITASGSGAENAAVTLDVGADTIDFAEMEDTLDLDANLVVNQGASTWTQDFTGNTTTGFTFNADYVSSGTGVLISADSLTSSGEALNVATTNTDNDGGEGYSLYLSSTNLNTLSSNTIHGVYHVLTDAMGLGNTDYGYTSTVNATGNTAGLKTAVGYYASVTNTNAAQDQGTRYTYGGVFTANGHTNGTSIAWGLYASAVDADTNIGIYAESEAGTVAQFNRTVDDGTIVDLQQGDATEGTISVSGNTVSYNAFTGSHYARAAGPVEKGLLVRLTGDNGRLHDAPASEIIYGVEETATANDPAVLGAYLSLLEPSKPEGSENPHLVMAVGNGVMWVADDGEDLEAGDYLISSDVPGHAIKDTGAYPVSHVVARLAEPVDWNFVEETVDDGTLRKHKLVSVLFANFDLPHEEETIRGLQDKIDSLESRLQRLEGAL